MRKLQTLDLKTFSVLEMLRCSSMLRSATQKADTVEDAAQLVASTLYHMFVTRDDGRSTKLRSQCALVRLYMTQPYDSLPPDLRDFAHQRLQGVVPSGAMKNLVLLGTAGDEADWNDRHRSVGHRAIPLPSVEIVEQAPMIAQLIRGMGLDIADVVDPSASILHDADGKTHNVFYVEHALGSPYIPAQLEFVEPHGVKSVIGFGGVLNSGEFFAVVLFTKLPVSAEVATRFRHVALDVKAILFGLSGRPVLRPFLPDRIR